MDVVRFLSACDEESGDIRNTTMPTRLCSSLKKCANAVDVGLDKDTSTAKDLKTSKKTSIAAFQRLENLKNMQSLCVRVFEGEGGGGVYVCVTCD